MSRVKSSYKSGGPAKASCSVSINTKVISVLSPVDKGHVFVKVPAGSEKEVIERAIDYLSDLLLELKTDTLSE